MSKILIWIKQNLLLLICCVAIVCIGIEQFRYERVINTKLDNLDWRVAVADYDRENTISVEIGVIQFLKRGYSITLDSADYTQAGLVVSGRIGNPTNRWLTSLTLNLKATRPLYTAREKYLKSNFRYLLGPDEIGKAQTQVGSVAPGKTATFRVTIPNVKQTSEGIQLEVTFSGERYFYAEG